MFLGTQSNERLNHLSLGVRIVAGHIVINEVSEI